MKKTNYTILILVSLVLVSSVPISAYAPIPGCPPPGMVFKTDGRPIIMSCVQNEWECPELVGGTLGQSLTIYCSVGGNDWLIYEIPMTVLDKQNKVW